MAFLAMRGCGAVNGVSQLHGRVSRHLFGALFPRWPEDEVPVGHVTNGVHMPTWDSQLADAVWTDACGKDRWNGMSPTLEEEMRFVSDEKIWTLRTGSRALLVNYARDRVARQLTASGADGAAIGRLQARLNPNALTLGFARRFATYKRPNLLLLDPERLIRLLSNPARPTQLIIAGKAHPADQAGQALIREWTRFISRTDPSPPVIFLADYDMLLAEQMVQGVDVWINTPRRPWEASGTSGMKVLVNGGLNLSELDGWWAEAYLPDVGWALGDGQEHGDDPAWDAAESDALYERLEHEVIPEFYARNAQGLPVAWVKRIRESMARLTLRFSVTRTIREYTEQRYLPAAEAYRFRSAERGAEAQSIVAWLKEWRAKCSSIFFDSVTFETNDQEHVVVAKIFLGDADPITVKVELYANGQKGGGALHQEMTRVRTEMPVSGSHTYCTTVPATRPPSDYTARICPHRHGLSVPLEADWILWQK
jgi:starch phosphorylase